MKRSIPKTWKTADVRTPHRRGSSLLELIAASALVSLVLVSTLALLRDSSEMDRRGESQRALTTQAVSLLERELALAAAEFTEAKSNGTLAAEGYPDFHYYATRVTDVANGGIPDRLMALSVIVWEDLDANGRPGSHEPAASMHTKVAKLASYQDAAKNN